MSFKPKRDSLEGEEEAAGEEEEHQGQVEHPGLPRHHHPPVAVEPVPPREHLPFPAGSPAAVSGAGRRLGAGGGGRCRRGGAAGAAGADLRVPDRSVRNRVLDLRHES